MNKKYNKWLLISGVGIIVVSSIVLINPILNYFSKGNGSAMVENMKSLTSNELKSKVVENSTKLPIPPLLENKSSDINTADFTLNVQKGITSFFPGVKTETYGYNGNFLGPVIRVKRGEKVNIHVNNQLSEPTTVHWHGLEVNGEMDGGPHSPIMPGSQWNPSFTINQPASTLWYHPHQQGKTGEQVYKGLAGLFYIDDNISESLNIPKEYGINDIPLIIQDRAFNRNGDMPYSTNMSSMMDGAIGDMVIVNGAIKPYLDVKKIKMRFRIVNGANAKVYPIKLSNGESFFQIASDGGFLEAPVKLNKLILGPGERAEVIIDFSKYKKGDKLSLLGDGIGILNFNVKEDGIDTTEIPTHLTDINKIYETANSKIRRFQLEGMGNTVSINGKKMKMGRIDEKIKLNDTEIWEITNPSNMMGGMIHPFHIHGVQFQILSRDGKEPSKDGRGFKDTVLINPNEKVRIIIKFTHKGVFMYHCHILEHEDQGMMGQFQVTDK
ncbi:multicopper oxidase family protein [Clostridium sp.]|uniref:multicopper oxidase family protein n=1 Tax=Clostridium sp. TaxID=1506 RepID=UPI00261AAAB2|nr:multicopper oxidase domain-containing protein [uncultured Clostridium sp.]